LCEHLKPFARHRRVENAEAGDVTTGVRQIRDKALADRIGDSDEYYRDRACLPVQRL